MATFREVADDYVQRLIDAADAREEVRSIAAEIKNLSYESGKSLSAEDRIAIVEIMASEFSPEKRRIGRVGILKEADNKHYLQLVQALRVLLG